MPFDGEDLGALCLLSLSAASGFIEALALTWPMLHRLL